MPPFVRFTNCARVEMIFVQNGERMQNGYYVHYDERPDEDELKALGDVFKTWWTASARVYTSSSCRLERIEIIGLSQASDYAAEITGGLPLNGTGAASNLPNSVTITIKLSTGLMGRSFRGRIYHCGIVPSWVVGNVLASGVPANARGAYIALRDALLAHTPACRLVVASRRENGEWRGEGVVTPVTEISVENNIDNQRRRLSGPGRS